MALKSKEVQRQYPNLLERFLDFCMFEGIDIEQKAINFSLPNLNPKKKLKTW
jgi:hypothetical protein